MTHQEKIDKLRKEGLHNSHSEGDYCLICNPHSKCIICESIIDQEWFFAMPLFDDKYNIFIDYVHSHMINLDLNQYSADDIVCEVTEPGRLQYVLLDDEFRDLLYELDVVLRR